MFGGSNTSRECSLSELIASRDLSILNNGANTWFQFRDDTLRQSALDVSLAASALNEMLSQWTVIPDFMSDHLPVLARFSAEVNMVEAGKVWIMRKPEAIRKEFRKLYSNSDGSSGEWFLEALLPLRSATIEDVRRVRSCP